MNNRFATDAPDIASQQALDYQRIEKAIAFLSTHVMEQPDLASVARAAHLSEFHFQRVFTRWAGISPKRFLQFLTVEHAKQQLLDAKAVLDVALDSGLSSPGRLHDLFVSVEAVTPGEFKTGGAGIEISYGIHPSRFGQFLLGVTRRGVCWLGFLKDDEARSAVRQMQTQWFGAEFSERPDVTRPVANRIFSEFGAQTNRPLGVLLMGTNFQIKVWQALLKIPFGLVTTYESIGKMLGKPLAARAIGSAVGHNAIAYLIPCHRVIRKTGLLGGYRWNEDRKRASLAGRPRGVVKQRFQPVLPDREDACPTKPEP